MKIIFAIWLSLFSWTKIEFNEEKRHLIGCHIFQKRMTMLQRWIFHNKFFIRDRITICSNATNNSNFIKFWSSEHNHERICHGFIHSRGLTLIVGKIFDTTNIHIYIRMYIRVFQKNFFTEPGSSLRSPVRILSKNVTFDDVRCVFNLHKPIKNSIFWGCVSNELASMITP